MDAENARRIVELEERYMRMEKMIHDLSDVLVAQEKTIARLVSELDELRDRIPDDRVRPNEPPPHY
jgi:uncharacterized coiled-coil protein SlyX